MAAQRAKIHIQGAVQGVGFRPFIYRLAHEYSLAGWVKNTPNGVFIEAEGEAAQIQSFIGSIENQKPAHAVIHSLKHHFVDPSGYNDFKVINSDHGGDTNAWILPDIATCPHASEKAREPSHLGTRHPARWFRP